MRLVSLLVTLVALKSQAITAFAPLSNHPSVSRRSSGVAVAKPFVDRHDSPNFQKASPSVTSLDGWRSTAAATAASIVASGSAITAGSFLPLNLVALVCLVPSLLGYYKSEYGVSYAYGLVTSIVSGLTLRSLYQTGVAQCCGRAASPNILGTVAACHAASVFFYGTRLVAFLAYREICLPRFRDFRERIEERAKSRGSRLSRTPFILSCALLYGLMCVPFLVTAKVAASPVSMVGPKWALQALKGAVAMTWAGYGLGAIGDVTKSIRKAQRGEDALITGGVYRWFRHPNYTGELFGWTSSCIAAFFAVILSTEQRKWWIYAPYLVGSVAGAAGIGFVLTMATSGLEERQLEKYGSTQEYKDWVKKSWAGIRLSEKPKEPKETDTSE